MLTTPATRTTALDVPTAARGGRRRRHGAGMPYDRQELERSGWRTTLDYRENHARRRDGRLDHLEVVWRAEAERLLDDGSLVVVVASSHSVAKAWAALRREADLAVVRTSSDPPSEWSDRRRHGLRGERTRRHATR